MDEKKDIRNAPFLMNIKACRYYNVPRTKLFIEIDIINEEEKLILSYKGISVGRLGKRHYDYDGRGKDFFNKMMPNFGKINLKIFMDKEIIKKDFDNYEEFLDEITSD